MLTIEGHTIPHINQRYPTLADWQGNIFRRFVTMTELQNPDYEFLLFIHEVIEQALCYKRGISGEKVDEFDIQFKGEGEPGDQLDAPYHREHVYATAVEMSLAKELGVDIEEYEKALDAAYEVVDD